MPEPGLTPASETTTPPAGPGRTKDEIALDLMRFIVTTTGYGKGNTGAGFSGKPGSRTPEEQTDALLELFERCRKVMSKEG